MKKIVVFFLLFFIIFSRLPALENNEYESIIFAWQLLYQKNRNQEISFLRLNPAFFNFKNELLQINSYKNDVRNIVSKNNQNVSSNAPEIGVFDVVGSLAFVTAQILAPSLMSKQEKENFNNVWSQQRNEEKIRQRYIDNVTF